MHPTGPHSPQSRPFVENISSGTCPVGVAAFWTCRLARWRQSSCAGVPLFHTSGTCDIRGAYAVLAYVTQTAVGSYGWLTHAQAVDGLALAETTPGQLIMVLQFIGFIAAWTSPQGMTPTASAITGALVTTYVTFLPSFLFIFLGAPYIEKLRGNNNLTGALTGVTAAVVGVILNLAIVFGTAVVFPQGISGGVNWFAAVVSAGAFLVLYRLNANVVWVVILGGMIGLAKTLIF